MFLMEKYHALGSRSVSEPDSVGSTDREQLLAEADPDAEVPVGK
jgi:hypothetical protein